MQDIAGCRVVLANIAEQDLLIKSLLEAFAEVSVVDRRDNPSHGYRAVHVVATMSGKPIEIQVRTAIQHLWAELSEKSSDVIDPTVKYGGGPTRWRRFLSLNSERVALYEDCERAHAHVTAAHGELVAAHKKHEKAICELLAEQLPDDKTRELHEELNDSLRRIEIAEREEQDSRKELADLRDEVAETLHKVISWLDNTKRLNT